MLPARRFKAERQSFAYIKNLLEAYDNLAVMTILDGQKGIFEVKSHDSMAEELEAVLRGISKEVDLEEV